MKNHATSRARELTAQCHNSDLLTTLTLATSQGLSRLLLVSQTLYNTATTYIYCIIIYIWQSILLTYSMLTNINNNNVLQNVQKNIYFLYTGCTSCFSVLWKNSARLPVDTIYNPYDCYSVLSLFFNVFRNNYVNNTQQHFDFT